MDDPAHAELETTSNNSAAAGVPDLVVPECNKAAPGLDAVGAFAELQQPPLLLENAGIPRQVRRHGSAPRRRGCGRARRARGRARRAAGHRPEGTFANPGSTFGTPGTPGTPSTLRGGNLWYATRLAFHSTPNTCSIVLMFCRAIAGQFGACQSATGSCMCHANYYGVAAARSAPAPQHVAAAVAAMAMANAYAPRAGRARIAR